MVEVAAARVGQNVHTGGLNGAYEALGLISVGVELAVHSGHHALHFEPLASRHVEGAVRQDLDLETLEQSVILSVLAIPSRDPPLLETDTLEVETGGDLEPARVVCDHRPGVAAPAASPRHGLERRLAVGVPGVPVKSAAHTLWVEILGARAEDFYHVSTAEIAVSGGTAARFFDALESLHCGLEGILTVASHQLGYQRSKPVRRIPQQLLTRCVWTVKRSVAGAQQRQAPIVGGF
jgi:hypothetical protein